MGELGYTFNGLNGKSKDDFGHGSAKYITYMNVYKNPIATLEELDLIEIDKSQNEIKKGDILFTTSSETPEEVGLSSVWMYEITNIYLNSFCFGFRLEQKISINYMAYMLRSNSIRNKITLLAQGISRYNISKKGMMNIEVFLPSYAEQTQIGNFFKQLDDTIALHQGTLEKYQKLKVSYLEKMFPKENERYPELRFPNFTDAWEQRKLEDVSFSYSGGTPSVNNLSFYGGSIPFIRSGEINDETTELFITEEGLNNSSAKLVEKGNILYALYGATSGEVGRAKIHGAINQAILAIVPYVNYDSEFIAQWLRRNKYSIISTYLQGGQGNLSGEIVKNLILELPPSKEEQTKIGNFFKQLDDTIALHQREVEKYKKIKQSYLEKMFI